MSGVFMRRVAFLMVVGLIISNILPMAGTVMKSKKGIDILTQQVSANDNSDITEGLSEQQKQDVIEATEDDINIDINVMDMSTRESFEKIVENAVGQMNLPTDDDKQDAFNQVLAIFDSSSENYNNLEIATDNLVVDIDDNHKSVWDSVTGEEVLAARHGAISVSVLATVINITISAMTGGPISSYVRRRGASALLAALQSRVAAKIRSRQYSYLIKGSIGALVKVANPGVYLARLIDNHDKIKGNGWIELT